MLSKAITNPQRVLITSPHHIGDFIAKIPFIRLLKRQYPKVSILIAARNYIKEIVQIMDEVDTFIDFEEFFNQDENEVILALKALNIDVILHILSVERQMGPDVIYFAKQAGITYRIGNVNRSLTTLWFKKSNFYLTHNLRKSRIILGMHEMQWNLQVLKFFGMKDTYSLEEIGDLLVTTKLLNEPSKYLASDKFNLIIHPGSHGNAKEWPQDYYLELIKSLESKTVNIIITGSKEESYRFSSLNIKQANVQFVMGALSLKEFVILISQSDGILVGSTGPLHIASLFEIKALGLFPKQKEMGANLWGPIGKQASYLASTSVCHACLRKLTDFNTKLCQCMHDIKVEQVKNSIEKWIGCYENLA